MAMQMNNEFLAPAASAARQVLRRFLWALASVLLLLTSACSTVPAPADTGLAAIGMTQRAFVREVSCDRALQRRWRAHEAPPLLARGAGTGSATLRKTSVWRRR